MLYVVEETTTVGKEDETPEERVIVTNTSMKREFVDTLTMGGVQLECTAPTCTLYIASAFLAFG
jgi:hypothetical protein